MTHKSAKISSRQIKYLSIMLRAEKNEFWFLSNIATLNPRIMIKLRNDILHLIGRFFFFFQNCRCQPSGFTNKKKRSNVIQVHPADSESRQSEL